MSDSPGGRPRRTRQSGRLSSASAGTSTSVNSTSATTTPVTTNPYKKPTYLAGREKASEPQITPTNTPRRGRGRGRGRPPGSGRGGSGRGRNARPECVVTSRTESSGGGGGSSRRTPSTRGKKRRRGGYNSHDYHYGSDFDSDQNDSEPEQPASDSDSNSVVENIGLDDGAESDSDFSVASSRLIRLPSPPVPVWLDEENSCPEELEIPQSSDDLLLPRELVVKAVSIYESLRRFHQLVRLTPFRFEDFCAALSCDEQSSLLNEVHIQLLKAILREEDANGTVFGPNDCKDSVQATLFFMDNMTWAECLRSYAESEPSWSEIAKELSAVEYPFCGPEVRIKVLAWLVEIFLATNLVRESLVAEGNILHEDHCRHCNRLGELICCETCPAVYHLGCIDPPLSEDDPPDDWKCPICVKNKVPGVSDCVSDMEKAGLLIRHEKLGYDRHGRKYWFLVRRILVESDDGSEVWYYSTMYQVEELLNQLDPEGYEAELYEAIASQKEEIYRQMAITEKVTNQMNQKHKHQKTYIEAENAMLKKIHERRLALKQQEEEERARHEEEVQRAKRQQEEEKHRLEEEQRRKEEEEKRRIREDRLNRRNRNKYGYTFEDFEPLTPSSMHENSHNEGEDGVKIEENGEQDEVKSETTNSADKSPPNLSPHLDPSVEVKEEESTETKSVNDDVSIKTEEVQIQPGKDEEMKPLSNSEKDEKADVASSKEEKVSDESVEPVTENEGSNQVASKALAKLPTTVKEEPPVLTNLCARKSKALHIDVDLSEERVTRLKASGLYRLGQDGSFRTYVNLYTTDPLALSRTQHNEERDRKRHMSHKFSLTTASECKWAGSQHGERKVVMGTLRASLLGMENSIPATLMHVNWPLLRKAWVAAVAGCVTSKDFSKAMIALAACVRPSVYNTVWAEGGGHVKLMRMSALEREERKKAEKRDKKDRDDEEDRLRVLPQFVKYSIPPKHQVWKQKGEEYRLHGRWGWLWLSASRPAKPKDFRKLGLLAGPYKHVIQVKSDTGKIKTMLIDPSVFDKLMAKRSATTKKADSVTTTMPSPSGSSQSSTTPKADDVEAVPSSESQSKSQASDEKMEVVKCEEEEGAETTVEKSSETSGDVKENTVEESMDTSEAETQKIDLDSGSSKENTQPVDIKSETEEADVTEIKKEVDLQATSPAKVDDKSTLTVSEAAVIQANEGVKPAGAGEEKHHDEAKEEAKKQHRTELINVSLGIQSANRIIYPKLAHRVPVLENLLLRRQKLQLLEEKELSHQFGQENIEALKHYQDKSVTSRVEEEMSKLEHAFPLAASYSLKCYSYECKMDSEPAGSSSKCKCYSPMCRLKFVIQDSQRKKVEKNVLAEKEKMDRLRKEVDEKRVYSKPNSAEKLYLKKLPEHTKRKRTPVKYPVTSSFRSGASKKPSILVLPQYELRKLARTAGRTFTPIEFAANPKPGNSWAWPYPCGRPYFKTSWQFHTVHAIGLASIALQLRTLWASVRWDDLQMKPPNLDGKNQITTDMEIITTEILNHRIMGRFAERVQYLRRKQTVPIDAPKTIREVTPSRSGLRKRKRAESPDKTDPLVVEEWVDEDKVELWEIRLYGDKQDRKVEKKVETPATRTKSGVALTRPEKYDPSPTASSVLNATKAADIMREQYETELKMQRAVHLSKRDNHAKTSTTQNGKTPMPTASQQLQQQNAAAGLPANPRSYGAASGSAGAFGGKKYIVSKPGAVPTSSAAVSSVSTSDSASSAPSTPMILSRKVPLVRAPTSVTPVQPTKTTEIIAKIFPTPQGQRLVFQSQPHELTQPVLAQIQAQLQGVTGLLPGSTISFHIQQPVTTAAQVVQQTTAVSSSVSTNLSSLQSAQQNVVSSAGTPPAKVPIPPASSVSTVATAASTPTRVQSGVLAGQQVYKTADGKFQTVQLQPSQSLQTSVGMTAQGQHVIIQSPSSGSRVGTPIVFKKVVRKTDEIAASQATTTLASTSEPTNVVSSAGVAVGTPKKVETPTVAKIIQQGGQQRIILQGNAQDLTPQLLSQIQSQLQGLQGLPPGTSIPLQIQPGQVLVSSAAPASNVSVATPVSTLSAPAVTQNMTGANRPGQNKIQLSVLVPGQQVGQRVLIPGQQVQVRPQENKFQAIQPQPISTQQGTVVRASQPQQHQLITSSGQVCASQLANRVVTSTLGTGATNIVRLPQGGIVSGQQFVKTADGKIQAIQVQLGPSQQPLQQVILNQNAIGRLSTIVPASTVATVATASPIQMGQSTPVKSTSASTAGEAGTVLKTADGRFVQIRSSAPITQQQPSNVSSPNLIRKVSAPSGASQLSSQQPTRLGTPAPTSMTGASMTAKSEAVSLPNKELQPKVNEIYAKVVQTPQGVKFVLQTNGNELTPHLIQQIQTQIQGMNVVPGSTICFQIKQAESAQQQQQHLTPAATTPAKQQAVSPYRASTPNAVSTVSSPVAPVMTTPVKSTPTPVSNASEQVQPSGAPLTPTSQPVTQTVGQYLSGTEAVAGKAASPVVSRKSPIRPQSNQKSEEGMVGTPPHQASSCVMTVTSDGIGTKKNEIITKLFQESGQQPRIVVQGNPADLTPELLLQIQSQLQGMQVVPPGASIPVEIQQNVGSTAVAPAAATNSPSKSISASIPSGTKSASGKIDMNVILPGQSPGTTLSQQGRKVEEVALPATAPGSAVQPNTTLGAQVKPSTNQHHPVLEPRSPTKSSPFKSALTVTDQQVLKLPEGSIQAVQYPTSAPVQRNAQEAVPSATQFSPTSVNVSAVAASPAATPVKTTPSSSQLTPEKSLLGTPEKTEQSLTSPQGTILSSQTTMGSPPRPLSLHVGPSLPGGTRSVTSPSKPLPPAGVMSDQEFLKVLNGKFEEAEAQRQASSSETPVQQTTKVTTPPSSSVPSSTNGPIIPSHAGVSSASSSPSSSGGHTAQVPGSSKGGKKKSPKVETPSPVKNTNQVTQPKLISTLFKHKELLKKDIFKKRGLLEKELHIDIQKELHDDRKGSSAATTSTSVTEQPLSVTPVQVKPGQKRKVSEPKSVKPTTSATTSASSSAKKRKKNKLYCICQTPYDNTKFYVGCDVCSNWFHGECIGITEQMSDSLSEYICDACQDDSNKVYCLCRQPYDESQFYICCDTCQDWFHGRCVGVLQAESSQIDEYICPNCDSTTPLNHANLKPLSYEDYALLTKLLKQIRAHKAAWPFLEPVDPTEARNYYRVIKEPMDLQTVELRTEEKCYSRLRDFIGDITKIFDNCRYYNPAESAFYKAAESLESFFAQKIMLLRQRLA